MGNFKILIEFLDPHKWDLLDLLNINSHAHAPGIKPAKTSFCSKVSITSGLLFSIHFRSSSNFIFRSQMTVRLDWLIISGRRLKSKSLLPMFSKTVPSRLTFHFWPLSRSRNVMVETTECICYLCSIKVEWNSLKFFFLQGHHEIIM